MVHTLSVYILRTVFYSEFILHHPNLLLHRSSCSTHLLSSFFGRLVCYLMSLLSVTSCLSVESCLSCLLARVSLSPHVSLVCLFVSLLFVSSCHSIAIFVIVRCWTPTAFSSSVLGLRTTQWHFYVHILFFGDFHFTSSVQLNRDSMIRVEMKFDLLSLVNFN